MVQMEKVRRSYANDYHYDTSLSRVCILRFDNLAYAFKHVSSGFSRENFGWQFSVQVSSPERNIVSWPNWASLTVTWSAGLPPFYKEIVAQDSVVMKAKWN